MCTNIVITCFWGGGDELYAMHMIRKSINRLKVSSNVDLARMNTDCTANSSRNTTSMSISEASTPLTNIRTMDLLKPEPSSSTRLLQPENM